MRNTDIAIVGGGLAGSTIAAMLGRAGFAAVVIDPNRVYPPDFRCEKLDGSQVRTLHKTGLGEVVLRAATPIDELWVARFGRLIQKRRNDQFGISYEALVNVIRGEIEPGAEFLPAKVASISTSAERQTITLSDGEQISARLVVMATGLNNGLRRALGIEREDVSPCHSVSIGFDMTPLGRAAFDFRALTYFSEHASDHIAYLTLFPIGETMRANLFVYYDMRDPWIRKFREAPHERLLAVMPGLKKLTGDFAVTGQLHIRPVDLYVTKGYRQAGVVLVGDAFASSCPAAGTGANKVFADAERLCNVHIPRWLATPGMSKDKIAAFYDDPIKRASDSYSSSKAYYLRSISIDAGLSWKLRRWGKFVGQLSVGVLRHVRGRMRMKSPDRPDAAAAGSGSRP